MKINRIDIKGEVYEIEAYENPIPIGSVFPFAGIAAPEGFLLCNGQEVSRFTYAKLYGVLGDTYGAGDGSTTFNLPNLINRFIEGTQDDVGQTLGAGLPNISGVIQLEAAGQNKIAKAEGAFEIEIGTKNGATGTVEYKNTKIIFNASKANQIYGKSETVQPNSIKMLYIIKY